MPKHPPIILRSAQREVFRDATRLSTDMWVHAKTNKIKPDHEALPNNLFPTRALQTHSIEHTPLADSQESEIKKQLSLYNTRFEESASRTRCGKDYIMHCFYASDMLVQALL